MYSRFISAVSAARQPSLIREMTQVTLKSDQVTQVQLKSSPSDPCICSARNDPPFRRLPKPSDVPLQAAHPRSLRWRSDCPARKGAAGDLYLPKLLPDIFLKLILNCHCKNSFLPLANPRQPFNTSPPRATLACCSNFASCRKRPTHLIR